LRASEKKGRKKEKKGDKGGGPETGKRDVCEKNNCLGKRNSDWRGWWKAIKK